jgi:HlyD family secretion protein
MPADGSSPYRQKSLERLSSPERLDQLLRLVDRKSWLPLATLGALVLALGAWAVFGTVPERVHGRGILVRPREVHEIHAPGTGYLTSLDIQSGASVERGQELGLIDRPELASKIAQLQGKRRQLTALTDVSEILGDGEKAGAGLDEHIESARALAAKTRDQDLRLLEEEKRRVKNHRAVAERLAERYEEQVREREEGRADWASEDDVTAAQKKHMDALAEVSKLDGELRQLQARGTTIERQYRDELRRIADLKLKFQDYAQQIAEVDREIEQLQTVRDQETRIVAGYSGRILEVHAAVGDYLSPGDRIATMTNADESPLEGLLYFDVRDGKRLEQGMQVQVTPDTVERERFGGIVGEIDQISLFPINVDEAENMIGNRQIAERLTAGGYLIQVRAALRRDPAMPSLYAWTSSKGPDAAISPGTTTTARVTVDERAPITFVLPFLRAASGID